MDPVGDIESNKPYKFGFCANDPWNVDVGDSCVGGIMFSIGFLTDCQMFQFGSGVRKISLLRIRITIERKWKLVRVWNESKRK